MRVLLVHEHFPPDFRGGGEYVLLRTAQLLQERGVEVAVLTSGDPAVREYEGIETERIGVGRHRLNLAARRVRERARDFDLVQTFNYHACLAALRGARRAGKPVVCTVLGLFHDEWLGLKGPWRGRLYRAWERYLLTRPYDRLVFISDFSRDIGLGLGVEASRTRVVFPGIDLDLYGPADPKDDVVLFVGKLEERKGVDDVLAVARALPDVRFRMLGWGERGPSLQRAAPANLEIAGFQRGEPLRRAFADARIFFFPSRAETLGLVVVEAMASGCAVVSTVPLPYEGARVPVGDRAAMVEAVRSLWDSPAACLEAGGANRALAQRFTWSRFADETLAIYRDLTA